MWTLGAVQVLCKDPRTLAAGGGVEMEIARQLQDMARTETGLEQYAIAKFAEALEVRCVRSWIGAVARHSTLTCAGDWHAKAAISACVPALCWKICSSRDATCPVISMTQQPCWRRRLCCKP